MSTLDRSIRYLTQEKRMLSSLCVAYGTARESDFVQHGLAQEFAMREGQLVSSVRPLAPDALYDLASLTKLFTCVTLFRLIDGGLVRLDERIGDIEPRFTRLRDTTVYDVCCYRAYLQTDGRIDAVSTREEALARLFTLHRAPLPSVRVYSDLNALALGFVIMARTGKPLFDAVTDAVLRPAGMHETFARVPDALLSRTLCYNYEHRIDGDKYIVRTNVPVGTPHDPKAALLGAGGRYLCGHAGLFSTREDMIRFAQSLLAGELLPRRWLVRLGLNRTGCKNADGTYRQYMGYLCFSHHPDQQKNELAAFMGPRALGLSGFTGNHLCIDPDAGIFDLFLGNRVHARISVCTPASGRTLESYGLASDGSGLISWPDGYAVRSSVNYIHLKDALLHSQVYKQLKSRGWIQA